MIKSHTARPFGSRRRSSNAILPTTSMSRGPGTPVAMKSNTRASGVSRVTRGTLKNTLRYSLNDSSACSDSTERLCCTRWGVNSERCVPSAVARSPLASTSTASTRMPERTAASASPALMVVRPVPPLPATKTTRRRSRASSSDPAPALRDSALGDGFEDIAGVTGRLHGAPFALDGAVGTDQERAALDAHVRVAAEVLLDPQRERPDQHVVGIADQRDAQRALLDEAVVTLAGVSRHAEDIDTVRLELRQQARELLTLQGAARRHGLRRERE